MHHEAAVLAAAHHFAFDVEAEVGGLVKSGMEGPERNHRAAGGRRIEFVRRDFRRSRSGTSFQGTSLRSGCVVRPAVGQHKSLWVDHAFGRDADQVAHLALRPPGRRNHFGDARENRIVGRHGHDEAEKHVFAVEGEIVRNQVAARGVAVVDPDADAVARVEIAEHEARDVAQRLAAHVHDEPVVLRDIGADDRFGETVVEFMEYFSGFHRTTFCQCFRPNRCLTSP